MKIALLTDGIYPFIIGGMQRHSYFLAKYLAQNKIHTRVYHCILPQQENLYNEKLKEIFSKDELDFLEFIKIPFDFSSPFPGYYLLESYRYSKKIYNHLIKDISDFDFIYTKGFTAWYLLQHRQSFFPKIAVKLHGYEMYQYSPNLKTKLQHLLLRIPAKFVSQNADIVFSYGGKITGILKNQLNIPSKKIIEIPTGIEKNLISHTITEYHSPVRFVYVGRYEERKGIKNLNAALLHLIRQNQKFEFHFIGDIPTHLQINDSKTTYYGAITDYSTIQSLLKSMDVLVCPSYSEGMPNVIVEAMASGLTVVATNVGAVSELVNNSTGYLIENNNVSILKNALNTIINTKKEVLQAKKTAALQHIQNFTWEKIIERLIENIKKFSLQR